MRLLSLRISKRGWSETGWCRHGSPERYLRKHWYEVATGLHETLEIYFERQSRGPRRGERWRLFSIRDAS